MDTIEGLKDELRKVTARHAIDQRKLERLRHRFEELQKSGEEEKAELHLQLELAQEAHTEYEGLIDLLHREQCQYIEEVERAESQLDSQRRQKAEAAFELDQKEQELSRVQERLEDALAELQQLRTVKNVLEEKVTSQGRELFETRGKLVKLELQKDSSAMLQVGLSKAERKLRTKDTRIQELESRVLELMRDNHNSGYGMVPVGQATLLGRATRKLSGWFSN